jgi:galactonate dehydratase
MKISDVRTMRLVGPLPHGGGGSKGTRSKVVVRVDTDQGLYGLGEVEDFMGVREAIAYAKAWLVGRSPFDVRPFVSEMVYGTLPPHPPVREFVHERFAETFRPTLICSPTATPTGPIVWALSGVEMALCDLVGKALKTPVYNLLGGKFRDGVRIYLDRSSPSQVDNLDAWKRMASESIEGGFTQLKFDIDYAASDCTQDCWNRSISSQQISRIVERISAVRETVGQSVELCVDCHMHYNAVDAIRVATELAPLRLMWLEDPMPITNPDACASVREKSPIPICVGEMFIAEQFRLFIDRRACDMIHPDVLFSGGLHETRKIADYAELHYLPMAMHGNGGCLATIAAAHVAAASRNFLGLEYHFREAQWIGDFVQREGVSLFRNGHLPLTDAPGLGVELNRSVCQQYLAPGESLF